MKDNITWDEIKVYHFFIYPDALVVLTNANQEEFNKAVIEVRASHVSGEIKNIDDVLRDAGFICLAGDNDKAQVVYF